uniref:Uncharacterized protein n=1 Tax=Candidatus Kentrum sp. DK TaxID=2126562 RepID=A0A450T545_9GAMM|nr:MAG: hypothetical protein BECKDK2373B_GA0170837_110310 [Candidatus Kentron sp. DK]
MSDPERQLLRNITYLHIVKMIFHLPLFLLSLLIGLFALLSVTHWLAHGFLISWGESELWFSFLQGPTGLVPLIACILLSIIYGIRLAPRKHHTIRLLEGSLIPGAEVDSTNADNRLFAAVRSMFTDGAFRQKLEEDANELLQGTGTGRLLASLMKVTFREWGQRHIVFDVLAMLLCADIALLLAADTNDPLLRMALNESEQSAADESVTDDPEVDRKTDYGSGAGINITSKTGQAFNPEDIGKPPHGAGSKAGGKHDAGSLANLPETTPTPTGAGLSQGSQGNQFRPPTHSGVDPKNWKSAVRSGGVRAGGTILPPDYSAYIR